MQPRQMSHMLESVPLQLVAVFDRERLKQLEMSELLKVGVQEYSPRQLQLAQRPGQVAKVGMYQSGWLSRGSVIDLELFQVLAQRQGAQRLRPARGAK